MAVQQIETVPLLREVSLQPLPEVVPSASNPDELLGVLADVVEVTADRDELDWFPARVRVDVSAWDTACELPDRVTWETDDPRANPHSYAVTGLDLPQVELVACLVTRMDYDEDADRLTPEVVEYAVEVTP
jgi:hypothetical protein